MSLELRLILLIIGSFRLLEVKDKYDLVLFGPRTFLFDMALYPEIEFPYACCENVWIVVSQVQNGPFFLTDLF